MLDILLDCENKGISFITVEEPHLDLVLTTQHSSTQSMHSVDNAHGGAVHDNRRKRHFRFGERSDVIGVLSGTSWRIGGLQRADWHLDHRMLIALGVGGRHRYHNPFLVNRRGCRFFELVEVKTTLAAEPGLQVDTRAATEVDSSTSQASGRAGYHPPHNLSRRRLVAVADNSVVVIRSLLHERRREVPVLFGQWTRAARAPALFPAGGANDRPLLVEPATLRGLPAKLRLDGLDGPGAPKQQPEADQQDRAQYLQSHRALRCVPPRHIAPAPRPTGRGLGKRVALR